jgi:hypothetical protein
VIKNFVGPVFGATATLFGASFDPRSGYFDSVEFSATGGMDFSSAPSCAFVLDNTGAVICAIGEGDGNGVGTGTSSVLLGLEWNPVTQTTAKLNLGAPPSGDGFWTGVSCASPNGTAPKNNSAVCVATTSNKEVLAVNFDPRTGFDPSPQTRLCSAVTSFQTQTVSLPIRASAA